MLVQLAISNSASKVYYQWLIVMCSLNRIRFIYKRYAPCRADRGGTRALAHLLAPQIQPHIQSKQKSQPSRPRQKDPN